MKVIHQLIDYFQDRGALTDTQVEYLRQQGFWPEEEEDPCEEEEAGGEEAPAGEEEIGPLEFPQEELPPRRRRRSTGALPDARELCQRLGGLTEALNAPLQGFLHLARRLQPCASWEEAVVALRGADPRRLQLALQAALGSGTLTLGALGQALDREDYQEAVQSPGCRPVTNAYRALLGARAWRDFGKQAWILRHPPVRRIFNLLQAKQAVLEALAALYREDAAWLAPHLRGHSRSSLFWALVILYNAERNAEALQREASWYWSRYPGPPVYRPVLERASLYALRMRSERVLPFLAHLERMEPRPAESLERPALLPPEHWTVPAEWTFDAEKYCCYSG